jgi:hypothetical protein
MNQPRFTKLAAVLALALAGQVALANTDYPEIAPVDDFLTYSEASYTTYASWNYMAYIEAPVFILYATDPVAELIPPDSPEVVLETPADLPTDNPPDEVPPDPTLIYPTLDYYRTPVEVTDEFGETVYVMALADHPIMYSLGTGFNAESLAQTNAAPVPVPAAAWLFGSALAGFGLFGRKRAS